MYEDHAAKHHTYSLCLAWNSIASSVSGFEWYLFECFGFGCQLDYVYGRWWSATVLVGPLHLSYGKSRYPWDWV